MGKAFVIGMCLFVVVLSGCGTCKQDLEEARGRISDLTAKNQQLSEIAGRLEMEKAALAQEITVVKDRNSGMSSELAQVKKSHSDLAQMTEKLTKERDATGAEVSKLKRANVELTSELERIKKQAEPKADQLAITPKPARELRRKQEPERPEPLSRMAASPCDAVVEYMRVSATVIERLKGQERESKLAELRAAYDGKIKEAPKAAREAVEKWIQEMRRTWDQPDDDSTFRTLQLRNAVLNACGKSATDAGF